MIWNCGEKSHCITRIMSTVRGRSSAITEGSCGFYPSWLTLERYYSTLYCMTTEGSQGVLLSTFAASLSQIHGRRAQRGIYSATLRTLSYWEGAAGVVALRRRRL